MKRKRGNKKGKTKKPAVVAANEAAPSVVSVNTGDKSGDDCDNDEINSSMEVDTPALTGNNPPEKIGNIDSGGQPNKPTGHLVYGRMKVKIKTSKALDSSQRTSSDAHTQSDTDKSSVQVGLEKPVVLNEKVEDSANSLPEKNNTVSGNLSRKTGSIKIKSSRAFSASSLSPCSNSGPVQGEKTHQKEPQLHRTDPRLNKQELNAALEIIKKVMKMDAAEPFNTPVNPIELGIPDYFDVINTPMDFGTICSNLENGVKYMNSADVFKDVQYIWDNCYKYNNKGDYIVELMKRVKKNFSKYWAAAGLYSEQPQGISGGEHGNDVAPPTHGKTPAKGGSLKHKTEKRNGVKRHKDGCLCAICVMMRRRAEREGNAHVSEDQIELSDDHPTQDIKPEETSHVESSRGGDSSSNMDNSAGADADADFEGKGEGGKLEDNQQQYSSQEEQQQQEEAEVKMEVDKENEMEFSRKTVEDDTEHSQLADKSVEGGNQSQMQTMESGGDIQNDVRGDTSPRHEEQTAIVKQQKSMNSAQKIERAKLFEKLRQLENPVVWALSETLFTENKKSIWSGPHSLVQHQKSSRSNSIHAAIDTFMN